MPAKYYIYASGRWCEVDTRNGRVAGFRQRARFCFLRRGKLEVGRSTDVLRSLRALAAGAGAAARDSAPLPTRRPHRARRDSARAHRCCSQHHHHSRCDLNANELSEKHPSHSATATEPRKRQRSTSEDSHKPKQAKTSETVLTLLNEKQCQTSPQSFKLKINKGIQSFIRSSEEDGREKQKELPPKKKTGAKENLVQSLLESSSGKRSKEKKKQPSQKAKPGRRIRLLESSSEDGNKEQKKESPQKAELGLKVRGKDEKELVQSLLQSSSEKTNKEQKSQSPQKAKPPKSKEQKMQRSSDSEKRRQASQKTKAPQEKVVRGKEEEKLVQSLLASSSSEDDQVSTKARPKPAKPSKKSDTENSSSENSEQGQECKELVIDDSDVRVLRGFLARGAGGEELERFDNDEEYKTRVFYKLHPLVLLKRCGPLEQLLLQRLSLTEFARHLGLRSVADVTPEKRYRMRHSTRQARNTTSLTSDSEKEKENAVQPKRRQLWNRDKELFSSTRSSQSSELKVKPQIHRPRESSQDSEAEVRKHIKKHLERRASAKPRTEEKERKTEHQDSDSIALDESSCDRNTTGKSSSDIDANPGKFRRRTRGMTGDTVEISDETDSGGDEMREEGKSRHEARKEDNKSKYQKCHQSDSDENMDDGQVKSARKTRSQGPEKRVLREHSKSVVISGDTYSHSRENQPKSRTKPKETVQSKSVVSSENRNTDENLETRRTRSRGSDRALKEQNITADKVTKEDRKTKKEDYSAERKKIIRTPMKGADDSKSLKEKFKEESSEKDQKQTTAEDTKSKENKAGPSKEAKETKEDQDKSVISDSDDAFETPKILPRKTKSKDLAKQLYAATMARNEKGRFLKRKVKESKINEEDSGKELRKERSRAIDRQKIGINDGKIEETKWTEKAYSFLYPLHFLYACP